MEEALEMIDEDRDQMDRECDSLFLKLPNDILHFIMFFLEVRDVITLVTVCRMLKDFIEKKSQHFWYVSYQVTCPFEWSHRLHYSNRLLQGQKNSGKEPALGLLHELGMSLIVSHKSKFPAESLRAEGLWSLLNESDHNAAYYRYVNPRKVFLGYSVSKPSPPSTSLCQELQFCDFPRPLYLIRKCDGYNRKHDPSFLSPGQPPVVTLWKPLSAGKYFVTWRLAVDESMTVGDIHLRVHVCDAHQKTASNSIITGNELKMMKGKGWFLYTVKEPFQVDNSGFFTKITLEADKYVGGIWIDWVRIVKKENKVMAHLMKRELDLTIQKVKTIQKNKRK